MNYRIDVPRLRETFSYNPKTGNVSRKTGQFARDSVNKSNISGYLVTAFEGHPIKVHRIAWCLHYGIDPEGTIDHINGIHNDNRIENLREVTPQQNGWNRRSTGGLNKPKGVSPVKGTLSWRARIYVNNRPINLYTHKTVDEACHAYNKAAIKYFGEYAVLNPIGFDHVWNDAAMTAESREN